MPNIFISYRRDDSSATVQILHDQLAAWFVRDKVFLDLKDIALGADWRKLLTERLADYDIVLVVIGPAWQAALAAALEGGGLIDFVRKLKQVLRLGKAGIGVVAIVGAAVLSFAWVNLFDLLGLDTRSTSFTMLLGDMLVEPVLSDGLLLVVITPRADETTRLSSTRRSEYARLINIASDR